MLAASIVAAVLAVSGVAATFFAADPMFLLGAGIVRLGYVARYGARWRAELEADQWSDTPDWPSVIVIGSILGIDVAASVALGNHFLMHAPLRDAIVVGVLAGIASGAVAMRQYRTGFAGLPSTWLTLPTSVVGAAVAASATALSLAR